MAISPAAKPISGLTAMTTKVSFHPPMNPTMKPKTKVEILSMKIHTWSAMALLILLMSLTRNRIDKMHVMKKNQLITVWTANEKSQLTRISSCSVHQQSCSQTIRSPFALLFWNKSFAFSEFVLQQMPPSRKSTSWHKNMSVTML